MSWKRRRRVSITPAAACDVLLAPVVTEKATRGAEHGQMTFRVPLGASKPVIRAAVETLFKVKVRSVNTVRQKGKAKVFRGRRGRRPDYKKAIVRLEDGQSVDWTAGV